MCGEFENNSAFLNFKIYICTCITITALDILYLTHKIFASGYKLFSSKALPNFVGLKRSLKIDGVQKPCDQLKPEIQKSKRDFRTEILYDLTGKSQFQLL